MTSTTDPTTTDPTATGSTATDPTTRSPARSPAGSTNDGCCAPATTDVCSLPPAEMQERIATIRRELLPRARAHRDLGEGFEWEFDASPSIRSTLAEFVAFERECCSGLDWSAVDEGAGALVLRVSGPGVREVIEKLVGSEDAGTPPRSTSGLERFAKAAGLGIGGALFVCCGIPIGAAVVLGATAAPLAGLDDPPIIAASALVFGAVAWYVGRRRERASACLGC